MFQNIWDNMTQWLHDLLAEGVLDNLTDLLTSVNATVGDITNDVSQTPANFSPGVFNMIRTISDTVIMPIAGIILTFIACYELIQLIVEHNNLQNFETWIFFKWIFKTFVAVTIISHTFEITMAIFDVSQHVINSAGGIVSASTAFDESALATMTNTVNSMGVGSLIGLWLQSSVIGITLWFLSKIIFVIVYARMIEIYLMTSLAPIPLSTFGNKEQSQIGQNYLKSLFALGLQGFLILICVAIYAVLIQAVSFSGDIVDSLWGVVGYTILLCFTLFKTGSLSKAILGAH